MKTTREVSGSSTGSPATTTKRAKSQIRRGAWIRCLFPYDNKYPGEGAERVPGKKNHACLIMDVTKSGEALVLYSTSTRPQPLPHGVEAIDLTLATLMGHSREFWLSFTKVGLLPLNQKWFPCIGNPERRRGVLGHAPTDVLREFSRTFDDLQAKHLDLMRIYGPKAPRSSGPGFR